MDCNSKFPVWCRITLIWTLIPVLFAVVVALETGRPGMPVFREYTVYWWPWIPITLLIMKVAHRLPLGGNPLRLPAFHLIFALLLSPIAVMGQALLEFVHGAYGHSLIKIWLEKIPGGMIMTPLIYGIVATIIYMLRFYSDMRSREAEANRLLLQNTQLQQQLADSRLRFLKSQLNPHFLFNTLNSMAALLRKKDHTGALEMLTGLSDLLRFALDGDARLTVSLREEVAFNELYLAIEKVRFRDRLLFSMDVDPIAWEMEVPAMLLHPLLENAIVHGVAQSMNPSRLHLTAAVKQDELHLRVYNDGPLLKGDKPSGTGIGLGNTRDRLERSYGVNFGFEIENDGDGVLVHVRIPARLYSERQEPAA